MFNYRKLKSKITLLEIDLQSALGNCREAYSEIKKLKENVKPN